jgi:CRP-like cAMP-binding protein
MLTSSPSRSSPNPAQATQTDTPFAARVYQAGEVIFCQGEAASTTLYIEAGTVRLAVTSADGKEAICGVLGAGAFLGEDTLAGHTTRRHTATAIAPTTVRTIRKDQMLELIHTQNAVLDRLIAHLMARETQLEDALADQILYPSEQRLARMLVTLAHGDAGAHGRHPLPHMSQEVIAEMVGTTRSRVNAFMSKFKKLGFIEEHDGELLVNCALLGVAEQSPREHVSHR